jgi:hypothetical protein
VNDLRGPAELTSSDPLLEVEPLSDERSAESGRKEPLEYEVGSAVGPTVEGWSVNRFSELRGNP